MEKGTLSEHCELHFTILLLHEGYEIHCLQQTPISSLGTKASSSAFSIWKGGSLQGSERTPCGALPLPLLPLPARVALWLHHPQKSSQGQMMVFVTTGRRQEQDRNKTSSYWCWRDVLVRYEEPEKSLAHLGPHLQGQSSCSVLLRAKPSERAQTKLDTETPGPPHKSWAETVSKYISWSTSGSFLACPNCTSESLFHWPLQPATGFLLC